MRQSALPAFAALLLLTLASPARADIPPTGVKGFAYQFTIANLADFPDYVFIVYPTSNSGYGYVYEAGKGYSNLMMRESWKGPGTSLYAMKRSDFANHAPSPSHYPHGDKNVEVTVVRAPPKPPRALMSSILIAPPPLVPLSSTITSIERVFRIRALDATHFDLVIAEETAVHADGKREKRASP